MPGLHLTEPETVQFNGAHQPVHPESGPGIQPCAAAGRVSKPGTHSLLSRVMKWLGAPVSTIRMVVGLVRALASMAVRSRMRSDRKSTRLNSSHVRISYAV